MDSRDTAMVGGASALECRVVLLRSVHRLNARAIVLQQRRAPDLQTLQSQETVFRQHEQFLSLFFIRSTMSRELDRQVTTRTMTITMMPSQPPFHSQLLSSGCRVVGSVMFRISLLVRMLPTYRANKLFKWSPDIIVHVELD